MKENNKSIAERTLKIIQDGSYQFSGEIIPVKHLSFKKIQTIKFQTT